MAGVEFANNAERLSYYEQLNRKRHESGIPEQKTGSVGTTPIVVTFSERARSVTIYNSTNDALAELSFSFDSGSKFLTLVSGSGWQGPAYTQNITLSGNKADVNYQIIAII